MSTSSLGALVKHRRVSLGLSPDQLAQRIRLLGHSVDIDCLEGGQAGEIPAEVMSTVAIALHWPPTLLHVAVGTPITALRNGQSVPKSHPVVAGPADEVQIALLLAEVEALRTLHEALQEWTQDLIDRMNGLQQSDA